MASTISDAWNQLHTLLVAAQSSSLAGVQVAAGDPGQHEEQEVVAVLGWGNVNENAAAIGNDPREERYRIDVGVKAHDPSGTALSVATRLLAISDAVRDVVKANRRLVGEVMCQVATRRSDGPVPALGSDGQTLQGYVCFDRIQVECWAPRVG
jgi:hypothetical protein